MPKKETGYFDTPIEVIQKMFDLIEVKGDNLKILEPGCASSAPFLDFLFKKGIKGEFVGIEKDEEHIREIKEKEIYQKIKVVHGDFMFHNDRYDLIIGNPPYGIISRDRIRIEEEVKYEYKNIIPEWDGDYNMYAAFISKAVRLLNQGGQLLFVVPGTFLFLETFDKFRKFLAQEGNTKIYYIGKAFRDANVYCVIISFIKSGKKNFYIELYDRNDEIVLRKNWIGESVTYRSEFTDYIDSKALYKIGDAYSIHISKEKAEIKRFLTNMLKGKDYSGDLLVPILSHTNIQRDGTLNFDKIVAYIPERELKNFPNYVNYGVPNIVVNYYFNPLKSTVDYKIYTWTGNAYILTKKNNIISKQLNDEKVAEFLRSDVLARYIKDKYKRLIFHYNIHYNIKILSEIPIVYLEDIKI